MTQPNTLADLITSAASSPTEERTAQLRARLAQSTLILPSSQDGKQLLRVTDRDGRNLFMAFTSRETLQKWVNAQQRTVGSGEMNGRDAFKLALTLPCSAVVIDAAGPTRAEFNRDEMARVASDGRAEHS